MKKTLRKIILIALLAVDVACLLIPWWRFSIIVTCFINGMNVIEGSITRTVAIFATYIVSVIFLEKKPKIFFSTGLGALSMYLAVVFYEWGFSFSTMPGAYIEILAVIGTMIAYVLMTITTLRDNLTNKISKKKTVVAISLGAAVTFAVVISLVVSGVVKSVEKKSDQKNKSESSTAGLVPVEETTESDEDRTADDEVKFVRMIMEEDYALYENALEWFFFENRGSVLFEDEMAEYEVYFTKELMEEELNHRQKEKKDDVLEDKRFPIFAEAKYLFENGLSKVYVPMVTASYEIEYGTYIQMLKSMPEDENVRYAWSDKGEFNAELYYWTEDSVPRDDMILSEKEKEGFHSISIVSVDNDERIINVYDNTYSCHYSCRINNRGQIEKIFIEDEDKNCYRAYYDFLYKNIGNNYSVAFRDFDGDGIEELMVFSTEDYPGYVLRIFEYIGGEVVQCLEDDTFYRTDIVEITEHGFIGLSGATMSMFLVLDETFYAYEDGMILVSGGASVEYGNDGELEYYCGGKVDIETYIAAVNDLFEANRIKKTVYGRSTHMLDSEYVELFADTHGISE